MTQPAPHPHHVSQLLGPAVERIVHALADRGEQITDAEYQARAGDAWTLVQSFQPNDVIDVMLTGQFIATNELFADNARDILRGMPDSLKQRARSSAVAMGRLGLAQIGELARRGVQPYRTEAATEQRPGASAAKPAETVQPAPVPQPTAAPQPTSATAEPATEEPSWVDEPYQEWLEATPAMLAARTASGSAADLPPPVTAAGNGSTGARSAVEPPHQRANRPDRPPVTAEDNGSTGARSAVEPHRRARHPELEAMEAAAD